MPNYNQGAPGNPLDQLLAGRNMFGNAGGLLYQGDPRSLTNGSFANSVVWNDPRYFQQVVMPGSEGSGGETRYEYNPATQQRMNGQVQLRSTNIGGPGEAIDPSRVRYDQELGLLTDPRNIAAVDDTGSWITSAIVGGGFGAALGPILAAEFGAGAGGAGAAEAGAGGAFDMGGSAGVFDSFGNPLYASPEMAGGAFDMGGSQGVFDSYGNPLYNGPEAGTGAFDMNGSQGVFDSQGNGLYQSPEGGLLDGAGDTLRNGASRVGQWVQNNPLRALSLANSARGLFAGGGQGGGGGGGAGGPKSSVSPTGDAKVSRPEWAPNPYLQAQLQQRGYL